MPNDIRTLNVILHGAFTFVQDEKKLEIQAWIPKVDYHVYRAGSWLAETQLASDCHYKLEGVMTKGPDAKPGEYIWPDEKRNVILKGPAPALTSPPAAYGVLYFPLPRQITSLRLAEIPRSLFYDPSKQLLNQKDPTLYMASLQIFTFDIEDENDLALRTLQPSGGDMEGHYWEPSFTGNHVNLHIFSSEDHPQGTHVKDDFSKCVELLGSTLRLETPSVPANEIPDGEPPAGVSDDETEALQQRTVRMARLGRLIQQGGDANLAWSGNDALDDEPQVCGGLWI